MTTPSADKLWPLIWRRVPDRPEPEPGEVTAPAARSSSLPRFEQRLRADWHLPGQSAHTPRGARTHVATTCRTWRVPRTTVDTLALITSELATNAVLHADVDEIVVSLMLSPRHVWIAVDNQGRPHTPVASHEATEDAENGRGLLLVEHLATRYQVQDLDPDGTRVWACVALPACPRNGGSVHAYSPAGPQEPCESRGHA